MQKIHHWFRQNWQKLKLYHIPFWFGYSLVWYGISLMMSGSGLSWWAIAANLVYLLCYLGVTYPNLYFLMPRFLARKRYLAYSVLLLLNVVFFSGVLMLWYYLNAVRTGISLETLMAQPWFYGATFWSMVMTTVLTMIIKSIRESRKTQQRNQQLEREKLETELQLLKAQLNPHFLFNAINSIYFLIRKDPGLAEQSLARFSEILRYQLYECNEALIPVPQEANYLQQYLELAQLRKGERLTQEVYVDPALGTAGIPPFLLLPLLENAIKHLSHFQDRPNWLRMRLERRGENLYFKLENTYSPQLPQSADHSPRGGIGLQNIQRRLDLLYPERYQLHIQPGTDTFWVRLQIPLQALAAPRFASAPADALLPQTALL